MYLCQFNCEKLLKELIFLTTNVFSVRISLFYVIRECFNGNHNKNSRNCSILSLIQFRNSGNRVRFLFLLQIICARYKINSFSYCWNQDPSWSDDNLGRIISRLALKVNQSLILCIHVSNFLFCKGNLRFSKTSICINNIFI